MMRIKEMIKERRDRRAVIWAYNNMYDELNLMLATVRLKGTNSREYRNGAFEAISYIKKEMRKIRDGLIEAEKRKG